MGWAGLLLVEQGRAPPRAVVSLASPSGPSFDSEKAGDREVQRTMLELLNQLDGFQPNTQVKVSVGITSQGKQWGWEVRGLLSSQWRSAS